MAKKKNNKKKRRNLSKGELLFQMKCNEIASKNIEAFMSGEITLQELFDKVK